jgi:GntR family L-lactate dehydrogenase operon transcriptional regulator
MQFKEVNLPIGATYLCKRLDVPQATVGRMLTQMEKDGLLEKVGNKGRQLTAKGLAYLEKQCIIDSKKKVASSLISTVEDISKERLLEILDVRKLLECRAIEQACANVTSLEMKELDEIMLEYIYEVKHGGVADEINLRLHLTIAKISKNITIYQILRIILTNKSAYSKFSHVADQIKTVQVQQHSALVEAVKNRDGETGKRLMQQHLEQVISDVTKNYD